MGKFEERKPFLFVNNKPYYWSIEYLPDLSHCRKHSSEFREEHRSAVDMNAESIIYLTIEDA